MSEAQDSPDAQVDGVTLTTTPATEQLAAQSAPATISASEPASAPVAPPPLTAVQLALYSGWTMAVLYGIIQAPAPTGELASAHELQPPQRRDLELSRLRHLLGQLSCLPGLTQSGLADAIPANYPDTVAPAEPLVAGSAAAAFRDTLTSLNLAIMQALTVSPPEVQLAYELGRSLRDTVNPPLQLAADQHSAVSPVARQLDRDRIAKLQEWLATLSTQFPQHAAAVVAASLGRWSDLATATSDRQQPSDAAVSAKICDYLLPQGDVWLMLLTGARSAAGLLSPEAYVAAGEAALRRSTTIVRGILRHYWAAAAVLAVSLAGVLSLAVSTLSGGAEVWTTIAAITGSLGISVSAIASTASRLAAEAERPVFAIAEEDAMAWAITAMPALDLNRRAARQLRKAGIAPRTSLGRI